MPEARSDQGIYRGALFLAVALILVTGAASTWAAARTTQQRLHADLLEQAQRISGAIDPRLIAALSGTPADLAAPEYMRLKEQLIQTRQAFPDARFLYLMGQRADGEVFFYVDSEPPGSEDESPPGQVYEEADADERRVFESGRGATYPPYTDRWGAWVSALVPIIDPTTGEVQAALGVDVDAGRWRGIVWRELQAHIGFTATIALLAVASAVLLRRRARLPAAQQERPQARYAEALIIGTLGLALTGLLTPEAVTRERRARDEGFERLAQAKAYAASEALHSVGSPRLAGLAHFFASSQTVEPHEFTSYVSYLSTNGAALPWGRITVVAADGRASIGEAARLAGLADLTIWEVDVQGQRRSASPRETHYPLMHAQSLASPDAALGFDLGSELHFRAALEAARSRPPTAAGITDLPDTAACSARELRGRGFLGGQPVMGGIALLHALRRRGVDTPMILLTGHSMGKSLDALLAEELTAWLPKSPSLERLAQTIAQALSA